MRKSEENMLIILVFIVLLSGIWTYATINNYKSTIRSLEIANIESQQREQKSITDVRLVRDEVIRVNNRYEEINRNYQQSRNTIKEQRDIITKSNDNNKQLRNNNEQLATNNRQLSETVGTLEARLKQSKTEFSEFRAGLERQSSYINEISKTITEIESENKQ